MGDDAVLDISLILIVASLVNVCRSIVGLVCVTVCRVCVLLCMCRTAHSRTCFGYMNFRDLYGDDYDNAPKKFN